MRIDLHVHTEYSNDCRLKPGQIIDVVLKGKVDAIAVTDHNEITGALKLQRIAPFPVIIGEEIKSTAGDIIGLFLTEKIEPGLTPEETVIKIKDQGGLVMIPHPFDRLRSSAIAKGKLMDILGHIDLVEVFNARNVFQKNNNLAWEFAEKNQILKVSGSDAHTISEIGNAFVEIAPFTGKADFLHNLKTAAVAGKRSSLICLLKTKVIKMFGG